MSGVSKTTPINTETGKVLTLNDPGSKPQVPTAGQRRRRRYLWVSLLACVILPVFLAAVYYSSFATDRHASRVGFSVRGSDTSSGIDGLGALTGLASTGSTSSDSYIVLDYLQSRALLEEVDSRLGLRAIFSDESVDILARLSAETTVESFVDYWRGRTSTHFDPTSGIIEFEVQSFSADNAQLIAETVLDLTQQLINNLSASARQDALRFARQEVELQETRMRAALSGIRDFRETEQSVNPSATAALEIELLANLEARMIDINARIAAQRETLDEDAPSLVALRRSAEALSAQIAERRSAIGSQLSNRANASTVTEQLAQYESLEVERALVEQAYASALNSLEQARRDAVRQQRYLAVHLRPQIAEEAEYPKSIQNTLILAFALFSIWGIGTLITYSVRDHLT